MLQANSLGIRPRLTEAIFFSKAQVLDSIDLPELLLSIGDTRSGWETIGKVIRSLERHKVRSLQRPDSRR